MGNKTEGQGQLGWSSSTRVTFTRVAAEPYLGIGEKPEARGIGAAKPELKKGRSRNEHDCHGRGRRMWGGCTCRADWRGFKKRGRTGKGLSQLELKGRRKKEPDAADTGKDRGLEDRKPGQRVSDFALRGRRAGKH